MKICGVLKSGESERIFLNREILEQMPKRIRKKYNERDCLVLCKFGKKCPYDNEEKGIEVFYADGDDIFYVCETKGIINKEISYLN